MRHVAPGDIAFAQACLTAKFHQAKPVKADGAKYGSKLLDHCDLQGYQRKIFGKAASHVREF